ncbi:SAM-dependent methyltransferase [Lysobacter sp. 5GHs7-4]|uniref:class I SAM-dependent methyltransferase n=1 Tax=Lysobacter sp. 5GHs7-4 TaxID=2904253 RepID=UPI001E41F158|nr:SAM-dependent methyltransferase [Lysobacter sp. 5GHs7-4]UHQ23766.1 SAM-dependent methyltransferase [Lysobacter sp. 5GHs7-4]
MSGLSTSMLVAAATAQRASADIDRQDATIARACLRRCGGAGTVLLRLIDHALGRAGLAVLERLLLPGLRAHYAWRKRRIANWAQHACEQGVAQVVMIGAGYDGLGCALAQRHPQLQVYELDRPASIAIKREALNELCLHPSRLRLLAVDLARTDAIAALRDCADFDAGRPTLCIAEGVLMYLDPARADSLLRQLAQALADPSLIATVMASQAGRPGFRREHRWVHAWLQRRGEPFRWGCARDELSQRLRACGWQLQTLADPEDRLDPDPSPGEWLFLAQRPDA